MMRPQSMLEYLRKGLGIEPVGSAQIKRIEGIGR